MRLPMITDREGLAKHLKVSIDTVRNWDRMGILPRLKIKNVVRYDIAKIEKALEKFERKAGG